MPFEFEPLAIPEVIHITPKAFADDRGHFAELFKASDFVAHGITELFVQVNYSISRQHVLRGLHYQKNPKAQGKLLSVAVGEVLDVAVDIRKGSPTYGKWVSQVLSAEARNMLYVPAGFAHGFCVLSSEAQFLYYCTAEYAPDYEGGILWSDPRLLVDWQVKEPLLSEKDAKLPLLAAADNNFTYE